MIGDRVVDAFLKKDEELNLENSDSKTDYAATAYRMISRLLNLIPTDMSIEKLAFKIDDNGKKANMVPIPTIGKIIIS